MSVLFWQQVTMHFPKSAFYQLLLGQKTRNSNWNQNIVNHILQLQTILLKTFDLLFVLRLLSSTFPSLLLLSSPFQNFSTWKNGLFKNAWIWMFCFYYYHHNKGIWKKTLKYKSHCNDGYKGVLLHPIPLLEIFLFFEIWHFLIKSSDFGDWAHQGGFLC